MVATIGYVKERFERFNREIFAGRLPEIPVELNDSIRTIGQCKYTSTTIGDSRKHDSFRLSFSTRFDLPERDLEDVIIHEMIHYFILYNGLADSGPHGRIFKAIMQSVNKKFGRNLSVKYNEAERTPLTMVDSKKRWHIIAAIHLKSGKTGLKVLPRVIPKVIAYYNACTRLPEVEYVKLYLHDNPFFNKYPTSTALHIYNIEKAILEENLKSARPLEITGNKIIESRSRR